MNTTVPSGLDDATLAEHLCALRSGTLSWEGAEGDLVLREARARVGHLASNVGLDPSDAVAHAWQVWAVEMSEAQILEHAGHLWAYTAGAVARNLRHEAAAQRALTSVDAARHGAIRDVTVSGPDALEHLQSPSADADESTIGASASPGQRAALSAITHLLVAAGLTPAQRDEVLDVLATQLATSKSTRSASDSLLRKADSLHLSIPGGRFKALVQLTLGTPKGTPGLVHLIGEGHPAPTREPHIARLVAAFMGAAPAAA